VPELELSVEQALLIGAGPHGVTVLVALLLAY
jgi:hypothetical protein